MAWFNWFSNANNPPRTDVRGIASDVLSSQQLDVTRSMMGARPKNDAGQGSGSSAQSASTTSAQRVEQRRTERNAKRELLFQVVRESMVRIGVLSSAFKFKVLSLDQRGRSFLVMIELSAEFSGEVEKLAEIESMIAQTARHRFEIVVQAVYWRYFNTSSAAASAPAPLLGAMQAPISRPAPLFAMSHGHNAAHASVQPPAPTSNTAISPIETSAGITASFPVIGATAAQRAAALAPSLAPVTASKAAGLDELSDDEVAAFRRALAAGAAQGAMAAPQPAGASPAGKSAVVKPAASSSLDLARSKLLLTGYEDTEMADDDPMPALSGTQYGELR